MDDDDLNNQTIYSKEIMKKTNLEKETKKIQN